MAVGLRGKSMRSHRLRLREDVDPMASVANLADVMLVFACGLMMALVTFWNIDVTVFSELENEQLEAIENPGDLPEELTEGGSSYIEKGMVYQDPSTGKYYMRVEDSVDMEADLDSQGSEDSTDSSSNGSSGSKTGGRVSSGATAPDRSTGAD